MLSYRSCKPLGPFGTGMGDTPPTNYPPVAVFEPSPRAKMRCSQDHGYFAKEESDQGPSQKPSCGIHVILAYVDRSSNDIAQYQVQFSVGLQTGGFRTVLAHFSLRSKEWAAFGPLRPFPLFRWGSKYEPLAAQKQLPGKDHSDSMEGRPCKGVPFVESCFLHGFTLRGERPNPQIPSNKTRYPKSHEASIAGLQQSHELPVLLHPGARE